MSRRESAVSSTRKDCREAAEGRVSALEPLRGQTLAVTGGTGFVGTWLSELVCCLNDDFDFKIRLHLVARYPERFQRAQPHLASRRDVALVRADVRHLPGLPPETNWLIHAAGTPDSRAHASNPCETMSVIGEGTSVVLRAMDLCEDLRGMLYLSSSLVYGPQPPELERLPESFHGAPQSGDAVGAYAAAKRFGEALCAAARTEKRQPIVVARPFSFVGPHQSLEMPWAANNLLRDALYGHELRVLGDGETVRSYLYASDMAFWLLRILTAGDPGDCYNVGSPEGVRLSALAGMIAERFSPRPAVRLNVSGRPTRSVSVPDVSSARRKLGLEPRVGLAEALDRTIAWARSDRAKAGRAA